MGQIRWTEKASGHLQAIHEYIAQDSKVYAARFLKSLIKATSKLEYLPRCGRIVPELKNYNFREVIYVNYRIVYRITNNDNIEILAVLHGARELMLAFRQEWDLSFEDDVSLMQKSLGDQPR
ncbi:MAG: type II toxin-antitoxin system RelE/ParE family toxin [Syntrophales bacterium]|nr:type II toxin-antitoxin system RelE/ParE family toxin [Syntrophales bacterium]